MITRELIFSICNEGNEAVFQFISALVQQNTLVLSQNVALLEQNKIQDEKALALEARILELETSLKKDSSNSSKPPSTDGYKKKPVSLRQSNLKKPGGQQGHPGKTLAFVDEPDHIRLHEPAACLGCGVSLKDAPGSTLEKRQVTDLPQPPVEVTEHHLRQIQCPCCGLLNQGAFPENVSQPVQYGSRIKSLATYLTHFQMIPYGRVAAFLSDMFGLSISKATLYEAQKTCSMRLEPMLDKIKEMLVNSKVVGFDETGMRAGGSLRWLHAASTSKFTHFHWYESRGKEGTDAGGIFPAFNGVAVHDAWHPYWNYSTRHALCNAHHLRELKGLFQQTKQEWASSMIELLVRMKRAVAKAVSHGDCSLAPEILKSFMNEYDVLLEAGFTLNPAAQKPLIKKKGRVKQSDAYNLLRRLKERKTETLRYVTNFDVPFDNNQAERDIRMIKVKQKVSGCFRTTDGLRDFCRIRSCILTLQKQETSILESLKHVFENNFHFSFQPA